MSSSEPRAEVIKPLVIKAAIPAALSVAAYICAKLLWTRSYSTENLPPLEDENTHHEHNSTSLECSHSENLEGTNLQDGQKPNWEDMVLEPEEKVEDLEKKETDSEARFQRYQHLKEKEFMLTEMKNLMMMEKTRAECLLKEISLMEEEAKRMGELVIEYTKLVQKIDALEMENGLLKRRARKHWRIAKLRLMMLRKQKQDIEARDVELLRNREELERRDNIIQELEDEVGQLKAAIDHLQRDKLEHFNKVGIANYQNLSESSNHEVDIGVSKEEYEKVVKEVEQLQKERAEEAKEVAYLKWSNACLRHQLLRYHDETKDNQAQEPETDDEARMNNGQVHDCSCMHEDEHCLATLSGNTGGHVHPSRRRRLVQKFKRWVEGGKSIHDHHKDKTEIRCFGAHSPPHQDHHSHHFVPPRNSCSSV